MQTFSLLKDPSKLASRSALLLSYIMGGNTGTFVQNNDPSRTTTLPDFRTAHQLRNELKSLLRGVYRLNAVPGSIPVSCSEPGHANPRTAHAQREPLAFGISTSILMCGSCHRVLNNSSGFSFDDDVANAQASVEAVLNCRRGNAYTAPSARSAL